jgi:hypothetical protein
MNAIATIPNTYTYISIGDAGAPGPPPPVPPLPAELGAGGASALQMILQKAKEPILVYL